ncbi:hypothetical protein ABW21_db0209488 [Orbilia brochopaga]|nr:hypothetical protein ABW21_db0209488 [Drechslerella brochopaga]
MRVCSTIQYVAIGLSALASAPVHAITASMGITNFNNWVRTDPVNAPVWAHLTENLQAVFAGATETHKLNPAAGPDGQPRSLGTLFDELRTLFEEIGAREIARDNQDEVVVVDETGVRTEINEPLVPPVNIWANTIADLQAEFETWAITIRRDVWEDRIGNNNNVKMTVIEAVNDLANYLEYNVDLSDPTRVAMWALDGRTGIVAGDIVTYDTASPAKLQPAFNLIGQAFGHLAQLVTTVYNRASTRLSADYGDRLYLFGVETRLRRLQNLCYYYQGLFE